MNRPQAVRVLFVSMEYLGPLFSGNGLYSRSLVRALKAGGATVMVLSGRPDTSSVAGQDEEVQQAALPPHAIVDIALPSVSWRRLDRLSGWQHFAGACASPEVAIRVAAFAPTIVFAVDWHGVRAWHAICTGLADGTVPGASNPQTESRETAAHASCDERACIATLPLIYLNFRVYSTSISLFNVPPDSPGNDNSGPAAEAAFYRRMESSCMRAPHLAASVALCRADVVSLIALHAGVDPLTGKPFDVDSGQTLASALAGTHASSGDSLPAHVAARRPPLPRLPGHGCGAAVAADPPMFVLLPPLRSDIACLATGSPGVSDKADTPRPGCQALLSTVKADPELTSSSGRGTPMRGSVETGQRCLLACCVRLSPEKGAHRFASVVQAMRRCGGADAAKCPAAEPPGRAGVTQRPDASCAAPSDKGCAAPLAMGPVAACVCGDAGSPRAVPVPFLCGAAGDSAYAEAVRSAVAGAGDATCDCAPGTAGACDDSACEELGSGSAMPAHAPHAETASAEPGSGRGCGAGCGCTHTPVLDAAGDRGAVPAALLHALPEAAAMHASTGCCDCSGGHSALAVPTACPCPAASASCEAGSPTCAGAAGSTCSKCPGGCEGGCTVANAAVSGRGIVATRFLGPPDMAQALRHTLLNAHPPDSDAYGMTIVEAAAFGAPTLLQLPRARGDTAGSAAPSAAAPATCGRSSLAPEHRAWLRFEPVVTPAAGASGRDTHPVVPAAPLRGFMRVAVSSDTSSGVEGLAPAATSAPAAVQPAAAIATLPESRTLCDSAGSVRARASHLLATCSYPPVGACDLLGDPLPLESLLADSPNSPVNGVRGIGSARPLDSGGLQWPVGTSEADAPSAARVAHAQTAAILGVEWWQCDTAAGVSAVAASLRALFASPAATRRLREVGVAARQAALSWTETGSAAAMMHLAETFGSAGAT